MSSGKKPVTSQHLLPANESPVITNTVTIQKLPIFDSAASGTLETSGKTHSLYLKDVKNIRE